jgi:hypothetical protein
MDMLSEQNDEGHHDAEQAGEFAEREADEQFVNWPAAHRIAQRAREVIAEDDADADARADQRDRGKAGAEKSCRFNDPCS